MWFVNGFKKHSRVNSAALFALVSPEIPFARYFNAYTWLGVALCLLSISASAAPRVTTGLQALYTFEEGSGNIVSDVSGVGTPLDLTIESPAATNWVTGGLSVNSSAVIASAGAASKVITAVKASNALSVEAWLKPSNTTQNGPARIVSLSLDPSNRNFTLGQSLSKYNFRLRSSSTSTNGIPSVTTNSGFAATALTHVIYTRNAAGLATLYVDGVAQASATIDGNLTTWNPWDDGYRLGLANELTGDRPWLGELHLVAIFDRALSATEVTQNFTAGPDGSEGGGTGGGSVNVLPVANAGIDQIVTEGSIVNLTGAASSDTDGTVVSYSWVQIVGPNVVLSDTSSILPNFTAPNFIPGPNLYTVLTFQLTVTDDSGGTDTSTVKISIKANTDTTSPTITATVSPAANMAGWHNSDVIVSFTCNDADGDVISCSAPVTVTTEGATQTIIGTVNDSAGNSASTSVTLNIDKTLPSIIATGSPGANASGWINSDVTVSFDCQDTGAGVATCSAPVLVMTEGANQTITGSVTDIAGNIATASITLNIDKSLPTITANVTPTANAAGWHNTDATITFTCTDTGSTVTNCPPPITVTTEGAAQVFTGTVLDNAGNSLSTTITLNIDKTPPAITSGVNQLPNAAGWNNIDITTTFICIDSLSGMASCTSPIVTSTEAANQAITGTAVDLAGNISTDSFVLNIDKTASQITATSTPTANAAGWNKTDVTVSFACTDSGSGASSCPLSIVVTTEGANQVIDAQVVDMAGNVTTVTHFVSIDKTAPSITVTGPSNGAVFADTNVTVTGLVTDVNSSVAVLVNGALVTLNQDGLFSQTLTLSDGVNAIVVSAIDAAGNARESSLQVTLNTNATPVISSEPAKTVVQGHIYLYPVDAVDAESSVLSYRLLTAPATMQINPTTGLIRWLPQNVGQENIVLEVADASGAIATQNFTLIILPEQVNATYTGQDFVLMFNDQIVTSSGFNGNEFHLFFASDLPSVATVNISIPGLSYVQQVDVLPGTVGQLDLTALAANLKFNKLGIQSAGVLINSSQNISVVLLNRQQFSTDTALVLPVSSLDNEYIVTTYQSPKFSQVRGVSTAENRPFMGIVASEDNTQITVISTVDYNDGIAPRLQGIPYNIQLSRGDTYQAYSIGDLSGTSISSDKPVAVFAGNGCSPVQEFYCDHLVENILPVNTWAAEYYVTPLAMRANGDTFMVYGAYDNTVIRLNDFYLTKLNKGQSYEFIEANPSKITANKPFALMQLSNGVLYDQSTTGSPIGDPAMLMVQPQEHYLSRYVVSTLPETILVESAAYTGPFRNHFANLLANEFVKDSITLDGLPINVQWQAIEDSNYFGASLPLSIGVHQIEGAGVFGLYVYGFDLYDSYANYGGSALSTRYVPGSIDLQRDGSQILQAGDGACVIATLTDSLGQPAVRVPARFDLTDSLNDFQQNQVVVTDSAGKARACFINPFESVVTVSAQWGGLQQPLSLLWSAYDRQQNRAPLIVSYPEFFVTPGSTYGYQVIAADPDQNTLTYSLTQAPVGMLIDAQSGLISWQVPTAFNETIVTISVSDDEYAVEQAYRLGVLPGLNRAPVFTSAPPTNTVIGNHLFSYPLTAFDPDYDQALTFAIDQSPPGMTLRNDGLLSWTPTNAQQGDHNIILSVDDTLGGVSTQQFTLTVTLDNIPQITNPPTVQQVAVTGHYYSYRVFATDADGDKLRYRLTENPVGMTVSNAGGSEGMITWTPMAEQTGEFTVTLSVNDTVNNIATLTFTVQVIANQAPIFTAQEIAFTTYYNTSLYKTYEATDPDGDFVSFRRVSGPTGLSVRTTGGQGVMTWTPTLAQVGAHEVIIKATDRKGGDTLLTVNISVSADLQVLTTPANSVLLLPQALDVTLSVRHPENLPIQYTLGNAPDGMLISSIGRITWQPTGSNVGRYNITAQASTTDGKSTQAAFTVTVRQTNAAPIILPISAQTIQAQRLFQYQVQASDGDNDVLSYSLSAGAPQGLSINPQGLLSWMPNPDQLSQYSSSVVVDDGFGGVTTTVLAIEVVTFTNQPPTFTGNPLAISVVGYEYRTIFTADDADGDTLNYSVQQGPQGFAIDNQGTISWMPLANQVGVHAVIVQISDGFATLDISWTITIGAELMPLDIATSVLPQFIQQGEQTELRIALTGGVNPVVDSITVDGLPITIQEVHIYPLSGYSIGRHDIVINASDAQSTQNATTSLYYAVGDPADTAGPILTLVNPTGATSITAPVDVIGSVSDDNLASWLLFYRRAGGKAEDYVTLAEGSSVVSQQTLARFDPTLLRNGTYQIVLQATDINNATVVTGVSVLVDGGLKAGNFSFTVEDLVIPMSGIPIRVARTYDTRRKSEALDFGYGWSIDYQNVTIDEASEPSENWQRLQQSVLFNLDGASIVLPGSCLKPATVKRVSVTLPNDDVEVFNVRAVNTAGGSQSVSDPDCYLSAGSYFNLAFVAQSGTDSTLSSIDGNNLYFSNASGNLTADIIETVAKPITRYTLTTRTGYVYNLDQSFGITSVVDPNDNTVTYSNTGITHSSGKAITFNRAADGRILDITDPAGNQIVYAYNATNDLVTVTDRSLSESTYTYNSNHGLLDIIDPLGRNIVKNIYDDSGRLIAQEDSAGNRTDFNHDIAGRSSIITDRLNRVTVYGYDDRGNVTTQIDALGNTTTYTFDADDNQLTKTDALGNITTATFNTRRDQLTQTDAEGNTVTFAYNQRGQETNITDALGNLFVNTYDLVGNLLSVTDPDGNIAGNNINAKGQVSLTRDIDGNETTYTYDGEGNKLTETDALNNVTTMTYDANNNVLTESRTRTVATPVIGTIVTETTTFAYDAQNRVINTTDALGNITRTEYDAVGNTTAQIDALGQRTTMEYDVYRRLTRTVYADLTESSKTYDLEGNLTSDTDRLGRITTYLYDALNRQTRTTYSDGTFTQTEYDAAGRVIATLDANSNRAESVYDKAGRRTTSRNALLQETTFGYDKNGNLLNQTDANSNVMAYTYDSLDRRSQTTYADTSNMLESYDALGRVISKTDQAGLITQYTYDALGRLTTVTDALSQTTTFTYDEAGNKLRQTDANSNTTTWTYDALGRVNTRTLPEGQSESFAYNANSNQTSHTDFNGNSTTFEYDSNNRLTKKIYADTSEDTYGYDAVGNRTSATNSQGTSTYIVDSQNRLTQETQSNGTVLNYTYDSAGNRTSVITTLPTTPTATVETTGYSFDILNRLETVTDTNSQITTYGYDNVGNRQSVSYPNGNTTSYIYDALNRLKQVQTKDSTTTIISQFDYTLGLTGRRDQIIALNGATTSNSYDDLYRLTGETLIGHPVLGSQSNSYTYDPTGNRSYATENGVSTAYAYDTNDRLITAGGETYTYDNNGNTLTKTIDATVITNRYDPSNRLISMVKTESAIETDNVSYQYDTDGLRTAKNDDGITTNYVVDKNRDYAQVLNELDSSSTPTVSYVYGDDLIFLYDGLGSTRALTDETGTITDTYDYSAYGTEIDSTGITENSYRYTGEQFDANLNQVYLRARYYDPSIGRFTQQDTFQGWENDPVTLHKYIYANADPANNIDPSGKFSLGGLMSAINVASTLVTTAQTSYSLFQIASGDEDAPTAKQIGSAILFNMMGAGAGKVIGLFGKRFADHFRRSGCSRNSFTAGTPVHTKDGLKSIEDIVIGDFVWATNAETDEKELKSVTHLIQGNKEYELFIIKFDNDEIVTATSEHPFFVNGKWVNAEELKAGDETLPINADKLTRITNIETVVRTEKVFNLTVDNFHTFHVGDAGYLVHNANIFCSPTITAYFPRLRFRGLIQNRNVADLSGNEIYNAFAKNGYQLTSHAINRVKHPRTRALGFNTLNDIAQIINRGRKVEDRGDVAFLYNGMKIVVFKGTTRIRTIRPIGE